MKNKLSIYNITKIAILGALAGVLMIIDMPIFVAPSFYKLDISDLPCIIGSFAMGIVPGFFIQVVKIIIKLLLKPTSTAFVGEIAAFIFSCSYCLPASLYYQKHKNKKGALISIVIGSIIYIFISCLANYLFIIDAYANLFNMPLQVIIDAGKAIFPIIHDKFSFVLCCVLPFNLIKIIIVDIITILLYKKVSPLLH